MRQQQQQHKRQDGADRGRAAGEGGAVEHERRVQLVAATEGDGPRPDHHAHGGGRAEGPPVPAAEGVRRHSAPRREPPYPGHRRRHHVRHGRPQTYWIGRRGPRTLRQV